MSGNNEPRCLNCFTVWFRHILSRCRWFGNFLAESYSLFFPVLTIIPSNVCFLLRSWNTKLSPFSCPASSTSMMIINAIEAALFLFFGAIRLFRGSIFPWESSLWKHNNYRFTYIFPVRNHTVGNVICRSLPLLIVPIVVLSTTLEWNPLIMNPCSKIWEGVIESRLRWIFVWPF